jgi:hypothetical protein
MIFSLVALALLLAVAQGFSTRAFLSRASTRVFQEAPEGVGDMGDTSGAGNDAMEAIKAKMEQDPAYDPMKDPEAMQTLEQLIPSEMRDIPNSVERLKVAYADATNGPDAATLAELGETMASFDKKDLISSPSSEWFQAGMPDGEATNDAKLEELYKSLRDANPDIPEEEA